MPNKLDDPAWRKERARTAGKASHSTEALIRKIVSRAPELTEAQLASLADLLRGQK